MSIIATPTSVPGVRIERVVTETIFMQDGKPVPFDNNVWLIGDDDEVLIVDASHQADRILAEVGHRKVKAIVCTHGHNDHINAAAALRDATAAPVYLNPADSMLWDETVPDPWDLDLTDGATFDVAGIQLHALHTPGHTPGATCLHAAALTTVFTGDTLFQGGPGATRFEYSDFPTIINSITQRLLTLPANTLVLTGHGDSTTIGTESGDLQEWIDRGW